MKTNPTMQAEAVLPTRPVSENGKINIYGGTFESAKYGTPDNENGRYWVLNIQNASKETADIKVLWRDFHQFQSFQAQYG